MLVPLEEQFAHQIEDSKKDLEVVDKDITLRDFLKIFINLYGTSKWSPSTYRSKVSSIENYINPIIGDWKLNDIIRCALNQAIRWEYVDTNKRNPASLATLPKVPKVRRKVWSIQTFREAMMWYKKS